MDTIRGFGGPRVHLHEVLNLMTRSLVNNSDTNSDAVLIADELRVAQEVFAEIDRNGDGRAHREELNAFCPKARAARSTARLIERNDGNDDGVLSADELGAPEEVFARIDTNSDGQADREGLRIFLLLEIYA